jgi:branched-chain amino acid transport system ATP-binding protein
MTDRTTHDTTGHDTTGHDTTGHDTTGHDTTGHDTTGPASSRPPVLEVKGLRAGYGAVQVIQGIDFTVGEGEIVVILGANGAGKTTTLRAISGMIETSGTVKFDGQSLVGKSPSDIVRMGVAHVPQGRGTLPELSVEDNLRVGAYTRKDREVRADMERWFQVYPVLGIRRDQRAGSLSGGEQQMLAVARALMARPTLLLLDEPSLGLAPIVVTALFERFADINRESGTTMLVVEQNAQLALGIADRGYVLESGLVAASGDAKSLLAEDSIRKAYLGV